MFQKRLKTEASNAALAGDVMFPKDTPMWACYSVVVDQAADGAHDDPDFTLMKPTARFLRTYYDLTCRLGHPTTNSQQY